MSEDDPDPRTPKQSPVWVPPPATEAFDREVDKETIGRLPETFQIDSPARANWLVRRVVEARAYGERVRTWAEREQRRAEREEQTLLFLFGGQLEAWVQEEIARRGGRRKTIALPAGVVGYRTTRGGLVIEDEDAVTRWARRHCPEAIVVIERLSRLTLREALEETGLIPEVGARLEPRRQRLFIR